MRYLFHLGNIGKSWSLVLLVSPVKPVERPVNGSAPRRVPDKKHLKKIGPKPINPRQAALAESLVLEEFGLFGALNETLGENSHLAHLRGDSELRCRDLVSKTTYNQTRVKDGLWTWKSSPFWLKVIFGVFMNRYSWRTSFSHSYRPRKLDKQLFWVNWTIDHIFQSILSRRRMRH